MNLVMRWYRQGCEHWIKIYDLDVCPPDPCPLGPAWIDWGALLVLHGEGRLPVEPSNTHDSRWDAEHVALRRLILQAITNWDADGNGRRFDAEATAAALADMGIEQVSEEGEIG